MTELPVIDGRAVRSPYRDAADVIVVGSGPGGAMAALELARAGFSVLVVEEGRAHPPASFAADSYSAMRDLYRDLGASVALGPVPVPYVQGKALGGTSVINGAISWRLPQSVYEEWCASDARFADVYSWAKLEEITDQIEDLLHIRPTEAAVSGPHNLLLAAAAEKLGWQHRPIFRNVRGCEGLGRCLQGCPVGHKMSMDQSLLPLAAQAGARFLTSVRVERILTSDDGLTRVAHGVFGRTTSGGRVTLTARRAVVLAASAIQSPVLLLRSNLHHGPVGENLQAHPGVSVTGLMEQPVRLWTGATQGHEVHHFRQDGIKIEALGYDIALAASRLKSVGKQWVEDLDKLDRMVHWGAAIRAAASGTVRTTWRGKPVVRYQLTPEDLHKARRGAALLAELLFAAGAQVVYPGIHGFDEELTSANEVPRLLREAPLHPQSYPMAMTHLFGTCRMHSDARHGVVGLDLHHHACQRLLVCDSSIFPSNTGVNPQTAILALVGLGVRAALERL